MEYTMDNKLISGKKIANELAEDLKDAVADLKNQGVTPGLTVILVGENHASKVYVRNKKRRAEDLGINFDLIKYDADVTQAELVQKIEELNADVNVDGILVQLPLPKTIDEETIVNLVAAEKDVDGFNPVNFGHLWQNDATVIPSTAGGIMTLLDKSGVKLTGKHVVIINRSNIVGRPLGALMLNADATVTFVHSKTKDIKELTKQADILVSGVGIADFVTSDMVKPGAIVIDVGMNRNDEGKLVGDVAFDDVLPEVSLITPVPGGVGPMTIITLMEQVIVIAQKRLKK